MGYGSYWIYYMVAMVGLSAATRYPWLLGFVVVIFLLRRWIPNPMAYFRTFGRISTLTRQIEANPANATARRDLAVIYLDRMRPGTAATLLADARKRFPDDPELLYLSGLAACRKGDYEAALGPLVRSVELDPRLRFGEPYLLAGDALMALGRADEAIDAYDRFLRSSSSSVEGFVKRARAHAKAGEKDGQKKDLAEALTTWAQIPGFQRRKQVGWWRCGSGASRIAQ